MPRKNLIPGRNLEKSLKIAIVAILEGEEQIAVKCSFGDNRLICHTSDIVRWVTNDIPGPRLCLKHFNNVWFDVL